MGALLLGLVCCSGIETGSRLPDEFACGWEAEGTVSRGDVGVCWAPRDADIALTPADVTDPCQVVRYRLERFGAGERVTVWQPKTFPPKKRDLLLIPTDCEAP